MGYGQRVTGHFTIVPPLNAEEIRRYPEFYYARARTSRPYQECYLDVERHTTTTLLGETVTLSCPRVLIISPDEDLSRPGLDEQLQSIVSAYPGHRFTGFLQLTGEDGDITRIIVENDAIREIRPVLVWPGEAELICDALRYRASNLPAGTEEVASSYMTIHDRLVGSHTTPDSHS